MVVLATAATVIASQAVISGAYSLTRQAVQLGLLPRLEMRHTSESQFGQIYMPRVNTLLLIGVLLLVILFQSSSALASAYGIAVTGTMVVTGDFSFDRDLARLGLAAVGGRGSDGSIPASSTSSFLGAQHAQSVPGRLGAALDRRRHRGHMIHLAPRRADSRGQDATHGNCRSIR